MIKKILKGTLGVFALLLASSPAFGAISAGAKYELNHMNGVAFKWQLGTLLDSADTVNSSDITDETVASADILNGTILEADVAAQTGTGLQLKRVAKAVYDCSVSCTAAAHGLGVSLPAKALITRSYLYVKTAFTDTGTCTIAVSCEDANNIKTATDFGAVSSDTLVEGASTGATSAMTKAIGSACEITATTADGGSCVPSTGYMDIYVEYVILD